MKVAAYQTPLLSSGSMEALALIRTRVKWCEAEGVSILCCPEAILGGLADYSQNPIEFAISTAAGDLEAALAPLASETVTTIVGFTELTDDGRLYNSAAIYQRGLVAGVYRKVHPAINRSIYEAGRETPVFRVGELTFGIVICNDSNYPELPRLMASLGATALFVPTNNGLPPAKADQAELVARVRNVDIAAAVENNMWVIRADVAGQMGEFISHGSSGIVGPTGKVVREGHLLSEDLLVAEIDDRATTQIRLAT